MIIFYNLIHISLILEFIVYVHPTKQKISTHRKPYITQKTVNKSNAKYDVYVTMTI